MGNFLTGLVLGFREGLEAFLIVVILLRFLRRTGRAALVKSVWGGAALGALASLVLGGALYAASAALGRMEQTAKLWESGSSLLALALITTLIVWMIRQGANMTASVEREAARNLSGGGIALISALMVAREGVEIAIFSFAGEYALPAIFAGVALALALTVLIHFSLVRVRLKTIFAITLFYLILQAGFLLGYGIHEGLSALRDSGALAETSPLLRKLFDLSGTVLDHKTGPVGLPLYVLLGWYSKPEILQFAAQYLYTGGMLLLWRRSAKKTAAA
jgi:high-affinity iron transporter